MTAALADGLMGRMTPAAAPDAARTAAAIGGFATSWFAVVLASAALVAGWVAVALVRTGADRPRWPWERDED